MAVIKCLIITSGSDPSPLKSTHQFIFPFEKPKSLRQFFQKLVLDIEI